jgi:hypothetical protein
MLSSTPRYERDSNSQLEGGNLYLRFYVSRKCRTQFMLPMEKSVTFTGACANEIIPEDSIKYYTSF